MVARSAPSGSRGDFQLNQKPVAVERPESIRLHRRRFDTHCASASGPAYEKIKHNLDINLLAVTREPPHRLTKSRSRRTRIPKRLSLPPSSCVLTARSSTRGRSRRRPAHPAPPTGDPQSRAALPAGLTEVGRSRPGTLKRGWGIIRVPHSYVSCKQSEGMTHPHSPLPRGQIQPYPGCGYVPRDFPLRLREQRLSALMVRDPLSLLMPEWAIIPRHRRDRRFPRPGRMPRLVDSSDCPVARRHYMSRHQSSTRQTRRCSGAERPAPRASTTRSTAQPARTACAEVMAERARC